MIFPPEAVNFSNKIDHFNSKQGETVEVLVDLESREYNGRWYTDVKAWKVSKRGDSANAKIPMTTEMITTNCMKMWRR